MSKNIFETVVGFIVLAIAVGFIIIAYKSGTINYKDIKGYKVTAQFTRIDGINIGSDVKLSGVKVGKVISLNLDPKSYNAVIELVINNDYKLPLDSSAEIIGNGLLGDKYISLAPGADEELLKEGGKIEFTQPAISFESLIARFIFGSTDSKKQKESGSSEVNNSTDNSHAANPS